MQPNPKDVEALQAYLPPGTALPILEAVNHYRASLKITKPRTSKLGDYRPPGNGHHHRITINGDLNQYAFLVTMVHELAHLTNWEKHRNKVKPHGSEWQAEFHRLMQPFLASGVFPADVEQALHQYLSKPGASSCSDPNLLRTLRQYDQGPQVTYLEDLPPRALFTINNKKVFQKGQQLRKRFKCLELRSKRYYLIHPMAEVKPVENLG